MTLPFVLIWIGCGFIAAAIHTYRFNIKGDETLYIGPFILELMFSSFAGAAYLGVYILWLILNVEWVAAFLTREIRFKKK